jgi:hypothetical protein
MFRIQATPRRLCDGIRRRDFLSLGTLVGLSLALPRSEQADGSEPESLHESFGRAKRCVLLFLTGGPPQHDTLDPKPDAPAEIRGEFKAIATNVPGIQIGELFPRLARRADKYCIVRSVTHKDTVHTSAGYSMLTGAVHPKANSPSATDIRTSPDDHPHVGAWLSKARPPRDGLPTFVALPEFIRDANVNDFPGQGGGFLGKSFDPFRIEADAERKGFEQPAVLLPPDVTVDRLNDRRFLRERLEKYLSKLEVAGALSDLDGSYQRAFGLLQSPSVRQAFELDREPSALRDSYGQHLFGQGCLLARRLIEVGVGMVTVYWHYEGPDDSPVWDTHWNNFKHLRERLMPPTDAAVSALLDDLSSRGLLADTLVVCMGEFGRTPRVNKMAGRDHWPHVQSIMLAGAGIRGGRVFGASDRTGAYPADQPITPPDLAATILHLLGVPHDLEVRDRTNRPLRAWDGRPVLGLIG